MHQVRPRVGPGRVLVDERDRARIVSVGRPGDHLAVRFLGREAERRDDRLVVVGRDRDQRRVDPGESAGRLQGPRENLVEVDRAGELGQVAVAAALLLRALERVGELAHHRFHAGVHLRDELDQLLLAAARRPAGAHQQDQRNQDERCQRCPGRYENGGSRHRRHHLPIVIGPARGPTPDPRAFSL